MISAAAASKLAFTTTPSTGTAGIPLTALQVAIRDNYGNVVTSNNSTVTIAVKSGPGGFTSGSTLTAKAVNGVATFNNLILNTSGTYTFTVTAGALTSATTGNIVIRAAAASKLAFTQVPTTGTAGTPLTALQVAMRDIYGNLVTLNSSIITIVVKTGPTSSFATGWTLTATAVNGVATFNNLILNTSGTYTFMATAGATPATTGNVVISAAAASKLAFTQVPTTGTAGTPLTALQVAIRDTYGNVVASNTSAVTIAVKSGPGGFASGSMLTATAVNGVATFSNLALNTSGTYTFTVTSGSLTSAATGNIVIRAAAASKLVFTQTPLTGSVNKLLDTMTVSIVDAYGNVTPTTKLITLSISSGPSGGNFGPGSVFNVTAVNGVAKFSSIKLAKAGKYTLKVVAGSLGSAISGDIDVS
ncbi:MAG: hypothetical protein NTU79_10105 [Planctomycetota bacterium]|nr:hypothetical protein [Planctomycetota bacterium]